MAAVDEVDPDRLEGIYNDTSLSVHEVADEIGYSTRTLYNLLEEFEIDRRSPEGLTPEHGSPIQYPELHDDDWLKYQYQELGKSIRDIADELGCGRFTVGRAIRSSDSVEARSPHGKREFPEIHNPDWLRDRYYRDRMSTKEIANTVGCSVDAVSGKARDFGVRVPAKWPIEMRLPEGVSRDEVIAAYEKSTSLTFVGEEFDTPPATVALWLDQLGVERRSGVPSGPDHPLWNPESTKYYGENWWSQRKQAVEEADGKCRVCGCTNDSHIDEYGFGLDVHHIIPIAKFDEPEDANYVENLAPLCRPCHAKYEGMPVLPK